MFNRNEILLLSTLACAKFTHILDFVVIMPLAPVLMRTFSIDAQEFALVVSSYTISAGIAALFGAFVIDKFDRKHALLAMYLGFILGTLCCAIADSYSQLLSARIVTGIFGGMLNTLILSMVGDAFELKKRATATGIVLSAFSAATAFGIPLGIYFAAAYSWNMPFWMVVSLAIPIWLAIWAYTPNMRKHLDNRDASIKQNPFTLLRDVFANFNQVKALILSMCLVLGQFMVIPFISPYMVKNIGFTELDLTYIYLTGGIMTLLTGTLLGRLADKFGHKRVFIWCAIGSIFPIFAVTHLPPIHMALALICTATFFVMISGRTIPAVTMVISSVPPQYRAGFMSFDTAFRQFAAGLAALLSGSILVQPSETSPLFGFEYVGYVAIGLTLFTIFMALWLKPAKS